MTAMRKLLALWTAIGLVIDVLLILPILKYLLTSKAMFDMPSELIYEFAH
jgi:hypothetical protein